ncbi:MAG: monofunctional biosynthetic peptidoglycan transglycosylase [Thermoanaerobaculales bacterium]|nr:monofunctional biosynthetic peptidoglycan transglycosylase [Thermoanaerobaculales bacterium]
MRALRFALLAGSALALMVSLVVILTWPDVAALAESNPDTTAFIEQARSRGTEVEWRWVSADAISSDLKKAVLVAEDLSFFNHKGFDTHEIRLATRDAIQGKRVRGASTLTQQLAKNLWLSPSRSPDRKVREIILTRQLERHLSKQRILEIYLNVVEFGPGIYGAEAASRHFFGKAAADLNAEQAARLAASLPRPSKWHPGIESRGYEKSVSRILALMEQCEWLEKYF